MESQQKELDRKLGIGPDKKPIAGSIWKAGPAPNEPTGVFRVDAIDEGSSHAMLSCMLGDGKTFTKGGHSWAWQSITRLWTLLSVPDGETIPVLKKQAHSGAYYEAKAQTYEAAADLANAKLYNVEARKFAKADLEMLLEEAAVEEKRVINERALAKLGTGDRKLFELRNLKPFVHYKAQMAGWLWYEK